MFTIDHEKIASYLNLAEGKPASMSSNWDGGYKAGTAVDGNTDAGGYGGKKLINTAEHQSFAWWKVDLQREIQDATVRIYFRTDYKYRRNGVKLYTSTSPFLELNPTRKGHLCHTVTGDPSGSDIPDVYKVTCPGRWRYLIIYTDTDNDGKGPVLDFAEIEVLVCSDGIYGENCTSTCTSRNCGNMTTTCDRDGRCSDDCQPGWTGVDCSQALPPCNDNYYGLNCDKICIARKCKAFSSSSCDRLSGRCPDGCEDGWREEDCTQECESNHYGPSCALHCNNRQCLHASYTCDHVTGQCAGGCQAGYTEQDCTLPCAPGRTYGVNCENFCSSRHCVAIESECDPTTGQCLAGCEPGWTGVDCASSCPSGTYGSNCTENCGECDGVCDSGSGLCYVGCLDGYRGAWCNVTTGEANNNVGAVVGSVLGTFLVVVLLGVGVLVLLVRQGRLQWGKSYDDKNHVGGSRDSASTQLSTIVTQHADVQEHTHTRSNVNNNYAVLDPEEIRGNKDYDVIQHKEYQNA